MRDVPQIWEAWRSGRYVGDSKPSTRVTVEKSFWLRTTPVTLGLWNRGPARWFQRDLSQGPEQAGQVETEIPNITSVSIQRSIDQDVGTCDFTIMNYVSPTIGVPEVPIRQLGEPGYFTFDRGQGQDARARWGHVINPWSNVLVPNALIRTYQGFGGQDKTVRQAEADGNIVLNGVWLVDSLTVQSDGTIQVKCRDMGKLLVDQLLYPPLVPPNLYPLIYQRYKTNKTAITDMSCAGTWATARCEYTASSTDLYYGQFNTTATGHPPWDAFDWNPEHNTDMPKVPDHQKTYWLSEPKNSPTDSVWIECNTSGTEINNVYFHAWAGNYIMMVSIFENGAWVPPEEGGQGGWTPQGIPYVMAYGSTWEGGWPPGLNDNTFHLPRDYEATKVRWTFTNLVRAQEGGYRAGARKLIAGWDCHDEPKYVFASATVRPSESLAEGYWQARSDGRIYAFGDAVLQPATSDTNCGLILGMTAHPDGRGYWTVDAWGRVVSYGTANHYGDARATTRTDIVDITATPSGNGYWLVCKNGYIYRFGDAEDHGHAAPTGLMPSGAPVIARSIESHPSTQGYWVLLSNGVVEAHNLTHYGNANRNGFTGTEYVGSIRRTSTGNGYWIPSGGAIVQAFGDAPWIANGNRGDPARWPMELVWDILPSSASDNGYAVQHADGNLDVYGDFQFFGSIGAKYALNRTPGNYKDYSDIVRELVLWAGFHLSGGANTPTGLPALNGNIESTGIFSEDDLKADMWDKKTVLDAIKQLQQIVGYVLWIDAEGGFRFESPNWFAPGNFDYSGTALGFLPEIDERVNLRTHSVTRSGEYSRSEIVIANENPVQEVPGGTPSTTLIETRLVPASADDLKGIVVPAVWSNGVFLNPREQQVLADLVAMNIWFRRRTGQISCVANPLIEPNDQIRIYERTTSEVYVHYVRSVNLTHDISTGDFSMSLTTHWLGGSAYGRSSLYFACDMRPQLDGYWQANAFGMVTPFGAAQPYRQTPDQTGHKDWVVAIRATRSGEGFYTMDQSGKVNTYGDAVHRGEVVRDSSNGMIHPCDMAVTPTGNGYWILCYDGTVYAFGDAVHLGNVTISGVTGGNPGGPNRAESLESHPTQLGYWILEANGHVNGFGACQAYGDANRNNFTGTEYVSTLRSTLDGNGYYIVSGSGIVQVFGNAAWHGNAARDWPSERWVAGLCWAMLVGNDGYAIQRAEGGLEPFNFVEYGASNAWTGPSSTWGLVTEQQHTDLADTDATHPVSVDFMKFLQKTGSVSAQNAVANRFGQPPEATIKALTE